MAEDDVLRVLFDLERATATDVAHALTERRGWAYSTAKTMLDRMTRKKLVLARRIGNVWEYRAAMTHVEAARGAWERFIHSAFDGDTQRALDFLASDAELTKKQRKTLRRLLKDR